MDDIYKISRAEENELHAVLTLALEVFIEFEAPDYGERGTATFKSYIEHQRIVNEIRSLRMAVWKCEAENEIVGMLAVSRETHISLLFVKKTHQNKGIARALFEKAFKNKLLSGIHEITVNSSPYAADFYHKLGFVDESAVREKDGIKFIQMKKVTGLKQKG